ncbi:unnamed protein product [Didymodactylos carnosus]|uniref:Shisa N-terminal domain-containing protein n=1 Tax=Didymodactylos carnosus TaxID=1234261 RepID=A0A814PDS2_9BILA|nr:unnamed protein product [Didymodactylos carnosus]CAF3869399.1 unnamed protein product [Didymodactylos carnosus]
MNPDGVRTSCPGYLDDYGAWNNGFDCPPIQSQIRYCCGTESKRYCCSDNTIDHDNLKLLNILSSTLNTFSRSSFSPSYRILSSSPLTSLLSSTNPYFSLPILISFIIGLLFIIFLILFGVLLWRRYSDKKQQALRKKQQQILLDSNTQLDPSQYPFSQHHHYLRVDGIQTNNNLHASDTNTTTAMSSSSGELSTMYFNDWKEFLVSESTPMNLYPSMSSNSTSDEHIITPYSGLFSKTNHLIV